MKYLKYMFMGSAYVCFTLLFIAGIIIVYEQFFLELWNRTDGFSTAIFSIAIYMLMMLLCGILYMLLIAMVDNKNFFSKAISKFLQDE